MSVIIHLTDLHLFHDRDRQLYGSAPYRSFLKALETIESRWPDADSWVITGDLAHDEIKPTYEMLEEILGDRVEKCHFVPGNHDCRQSIQEVFSDRVELQGERVGFVTELGHWRLIGLDTQIPDEVPGQLGTAQLEGLDATLADERERPVAIFMHHPPVQIGSAWLDKLGLKDRDALWSVLNEHSHVKAIFCGHVHQALSKTHQGVAVHSTPATCFQFRPGTHKAEIDTRPPGLRLIALQDDHLVTEVIRIG
jgi:3',5'-cyclic-AMP phosphodiesterase